MPDSTIKSRRRWYQFSLRTLLVVVVVFACSVTIGWVGWRMQRARDNRKRLAEQAFDRVKQVGVRYGTKTISLRSPTWLEELFNDPGDANDPSVAIVVYWLRLDDARLPEEGLEHLSGLTNLSWLRLAGTRITDNELEQVKELTNVIDLNLSNTRVTDAGLEHLKRMTNLIDLDLRNTRVTNAGLEHLKGLTNLEHLWLYGTQVTDDGVAELRRALPNCAIDH